MAANPADSGDRARDAGPQRAPAIPARQRPGAAAPALDRDIVLLAIVVIFGTAMTVLDLTIVNVAIPTLGRDLGTSIATIQWVLTGYLLAFASVIPLSGWAAARFGARRAWIASLTTFMLGSVLAGLAWSAGALIAFRVIQGLGAGMLMPVGQAALVQAAGPARVGRVMSLFGVPMLLIPTLGPVLGGVIVEHASWRWIFYINVPVSLAAVAAAVRFLPRAKPAAAAPRLDLRGLILLSPGIAAFLFGMSELGNQATADSPKMIAGVAACVALIATFIWHAWRRGSVALIDVSLFRRRGFAGRQRPPSCSVSHCSARSSCSRCTTRSSGLKARWTSACFWYRRGRALRSRCRWRAGSPTSTARASSSPPALWSPLRAPWPTHRLAHKLPTGCWPRPCSSSALGSEARSCPAWRPRSRAFPASKPPEQPAR